ncbi:winged helix-turn-helix domain-containing protein [Nonomuraea sp. NEAU-A123]|uniref:winged helix-turn-helix domain-containing protein n=1 Tax=Nonomuraea sp. NEAU-A123 TaxID=2839649 RepID=UPI001BE3FCC0|nr:crosslink repair DNA glycosylase YcaQ family protein [Nonomuraea sp. NEAU-A123]MBT2224650.1 winged helix DNA-binding domain-containing protein [Nonomuraea sp. NEAU-A123]
MTDLTADEARRIILRAQGLLGGADARRGGVHGMLRRLGAIQLDTISVLARSHELVAYARLGAVGRPKVERAYWHNPALSFEYWCHAACILPIEHWPLYAFRRRAYRDRRYRWHEVPDHVDKLRDQVRDSGPLTTSDVGGAKNGGPWWDWSDSKIGLEWLLDIGEIVCSRRVGWRRVYDLSERVVPAELLAEDLSDEECIVRLAAIAGASLGVATRGDLIDFLRLKGRFAAILDEALLSGATGLVPVHVTGWPSTRGQTNAWADPAGLESAPRGRHRTTLVSPFDSLIWHRGRTERVFGFNYQLELYVPKHKRVHGYFTMPVLAGGRLIGRVDPARDGTTLVARQLSLEPGLTGAKWADALRDALWSAADWVGCDAVRVERADPALIAHLEAPA